MDEEGKSPPQEIYTCQFVPNARHIFVLPKK